MSPNSIAAQIVSDPAASYWLKDRIKELEARDPVDALRDAEALRLAASDRLTLIQREHYSRIINGGHKR